MSRQRTLDEVRTNIDSIDDAIQDLLIRRTALVEEVRSIKRDWRVKIQPSREADIIYRLVNRHRGAFPKRDLVAMWRILICATLSFEGPFSVAVHVSTRDSDLWDMARDHFGPCTAISRHASARSVLEAVNRQEATVGVLPMPKQDDRDPWWPHLMTDRPDAPKIIARLPFAEFNNGGSGASEALVTCPIAVAPTGRDRSFIAVEWEGPFAMDQLTIRLRKAGFVPISAWRHEAAPEVSRYLVEVEGWLGPDDARLQEVRQAIGTPKPLLPLGGYATPLTREMLAPAPSAAHGVPSVKGENAAAL